MLLSRNFLEVRRIIALGKFFLSEVSLLVGKAVDTNGSHGAKRRVEYDEAGCGRRFSCS